MVICPACWLEQREVSDARAYDIALRREWLPRPVTSCALHSLKLIELPYWDYTTTDDHMRRSRLDRDWESRLADRSQHQTPTNFETLALRQLNTGQPVCNWLPDEQIDVLERWCFGLGILLEKGAWHPRATAKSDEPDYIDAGLSATIAGKDNMRIEIDAALRRHRLRLPSTWLAAWSSQNPKPEERQNLARLFKGLCDDQGFFCLNAATDQLPRQIEFEMGLKKIAKSAGNDYSVPVAFGHREVWVKGFVDRVVIGCAADVIAEHVRSYDKDDMIFNPVHYLRLIERKIMAFEQAAPLQDWDLPEAFSTLQRLLEARQGKTGKREYVQVLRLLEHYEQNVLHAAIKDALQMGAISFDAIKHLVLCRVERRQPRLDLDLYPFLPRTNVATTSASSYMSLLGGGGA